MTMIRRSAASCAQRPVAAAAPAVAASWASARTAGDDALADLVDRLPDGLVLTAHDVVVLADDLASTCGAGRAGSHADLLRRLAPGHWATLDLATLVASAVGVEPGVLAAALRQLATAGHPSRSVLLRVAARAADEGAAEHGRAVLRSLVETGGDDDVPPQLDALLTAPSAGSPGGRPGPCRAVSTVVRVWRRRR